jgi:hypothetical protein
VMKIRMAEEPIRMEILSLDDERPAVVYPEGKSPLLVSVGALDPMNVIA